jgi:hypothetical protein
MVCEQYAFRMAVSRITLSLPKAVTIRIKKIAGRTPVSTWVTALIEEHLDERELNEKWLAFYAGVNPQPQDVRKARDIVTRAQKRRRVA